ncbi:hypothetical protein AMTRI_Chr01g111760 [Amborella trichopoda]
MLSFLRCHKLSSSPPSRQRRGAGEFRERKRGREMAGEHLMKRIPRIKFPQRHSKSPVCGFSNMVVIKTCTMSSIFLIYANSKCVPFVQLWSGNCLLGLRLVN